MTIDDLKAKAVRITGASLARDLAPMRNAAPLGRIGEAQDCVGAFLFLASDELSGYVNGGMHMP